MKTEFASGELWNGDCLELMQDIPDKSIDMILCDLPYGMTANNWDKIIPLDKLFNEYVRIGKNDCMIVLTAQQPFTTDLINAGRKYFKYEMIWDKVIAVQYLNAKKRPMSVHENILVFALGKNKYNPQGLVPCMKIKNKYSSANYGCAEGLNIQKVTNYPNTIVTYARYNKLNFHPTQKPVELFEYLIRTYSNEEDIVLDNCSGAGTTAVAAHRSKRRWICIEKDPTFYKKSVDYIQNEIREADNSTTLLGFFK